ncbi:GNAT family N-acetyltransferase [Caulobacter hibisci]|uniref:GNAT family N-acetyltransferase n=1 Tax=Caulobacter hibisci TaxID=2035993 RepID=A0ABS0T3P2_9CAUL|nr:GNAT family N-acetyltransferase [Caulobacter hibisci]MBI1686498.1 GNAT family N-acetyltransferase [Caulobacter hibisci]
MAAHPLDRPVWSSLTGRQAHLAIASGGALRMDPNFGLFAAVAEETAESLADLAALVRAHGPSGFVELVEPPPIPGTTVLSSALCWQMAAKAITPLKPVDFEIIALSDADAPEMLALATLTKPGPFFSRTHQLGAFVGVKVGGELAAMAGERLRPDGFTEVSGVCTRPDFRGRGYAAGLMAHVASKILARGETPFLHSYADNAGANALYQALGFERRADLWFTVLSAD